MSVSHSVTLLLEQWSNGDQAALDQLMPLIYDELRRMARRYMRQQNPGHILRFISLEEAALVSDDRAAEVVAFDDALKELEKLSNRQSRVVELRYFGGLTVDETAILLSVSPETVMRDWSMAKAWLHRTLSARGEA
jgi:RNA polymerase sigma factor (sigma-70 family)